VWSEIDHKIDYSHRRGREDIPRNRHLTILKGFVDNVIAYVDEIKRKSKEVATDTRASPSLQIPEVQLSKLKKKKVPLEYYNRIERVYREASDAYRRGEKRTINTEVYKKGAKEFGAIVADVRNDTNINAEQRQFIINMCEMEYGKRIFECIESQWE
jgi:hypothetical protein